MTFYVKRPGQDEGQPIGDDDTHHVGSLDADKDDWALYLPHQCDAWEIAYGNRESVLAEARAFRAKLDQAIAAIEAAD